jgi:hypothetical protein
MRESELPHIDLISDNEKGYSICFVPSDNVSKESKLQVEIDLDTNDGKKVHYMLQAIASIAQDQWQRSGNDC